MARVLVTGSADGLGLNAARMLIEEGHEVTLHARSEQRAQAALAAAPGAQTALAGDLASMAEVRELAGAANRLGPYDAVIHNAAVGYREPRIETVDGLEHVFAINVLAPYLLSALLTRPRRLIFLSSGMHRGGDAEAADLQWTRRRWNGSQAYAESKLWDAVLAFALARRWPQTVSNAVEPGWVATKMGGPGAPDDLALGALTQVWLAVSEEPDALLSGRYLFHQQPHEKHPALADPEVQDGLLAACEELTATSLQAA